MKKAIVIGTGIVGLATARALAIKKYSVTVFDRNEKAIGASIRNFGMVWPIGQPDGALYDTALLSRNIWVDVCTQAGIGFEEAGSLHVAHHPDEWNVLQELAEKYAHRNYSLQNKQQALAKCDALVEENLLGALYSPTEVIVDPREAIDKIAQWLTEVYNVTFCKGIAITDVSFPAVYAGTEQWEADVIYIASGADFETLYPQQFAQANITKCKLQMMRMGIQPSHWRMSAAVCGALSLIHYTGFTIANSLPALKQRYELEYAEYIKWGIHVMAAQNQSGEITIGDSHEYGLLHDPFDKQFINQLILDYLKGFIRFKNETITQTWHGIYAKLTNGKSYIHLQPESGVHIINGLGGAGMTLSFGLCQNIVEQYS